MRPIRVAILRDFAEERWYSMDLVADMLAHHLQLEHGESVQVTQLCPQFMRLASRIRAIRRRPMVFAAERMFNRFITYPRFLRSHRGRFDLFHVVDHSYANLLSSLRSKRTVVTCHDLDLFEPLGRSKLGLAQLCRRLIAKATLAGLHDASHVVCVSESTRDRLLRRGWVSPNRTSVVPNGVHPSCSPVAALAADSEASALLGPRSRDRIDLLHVGSTIPRKRIDVLMRVFAELRRTNRALRLIHAGGVFSSRQASAIRTLQLDSHIISVPFVASDLLAAIYRRAALLISTSEAEGFGLPVAESLACGTPVVVTDLPAHREIAGGAGEYCSLDRTDDWTSTVSRMLDERHNAPQRWRARCHAGLQRAAKFTWSANAASTMQLYSNLTDSDSSSKSFAGLPFPVRSRP